MKKIFTFAAALMASLTMMAGELALETYNWAKDCSFNDTITTRNGVTLFTDATGWNGNLSGYSYIALGGGCDMTSPSKYFGISVAEGAIESVDILWAPNGTDEANIAWAAWASEANKLNQTADMIGETEGYKGSKSYDDATWQSISFGEENNVQAVLITRQLKKVKYQEAEKQIGKNKTINILGVRVYLKETKTIVSTVESLTAVTINDVAISATDLATLVSSKTLFLEDAYVTAPVVKFTKHTVITYDDESTKEKDEVIEVTSQQALATMWGASATINGNAYSVYTIKAASHTVTYMYGKNVLGTEMVAVGAEPTEYAQYQTMTLATFEGWYRDEELTTPVSLPMAINQDFTFYAKFTKAYLSQNVNIEQLVLDYGTKYDIKSVLTAAGWAYANLNDLDTLNDLENKAARNEPYLGLKLKTAGAYVQGWLKTDGVLIIKFGNLGCNINISLKGGYTDVDATFTKEELWNEDDQAYVLAIFGHAEDVLITISTTTGSTVVLKQLMLDELAPVTLPAPGAYLVTCAEAENGTITANWSNKKYRTPVGETVTLTATPAEGYEIASITVDGEPLDAVDGVYSFIMPAKEVTVAATFSVATALENIDASVKAVKVVRDGQLLIKKGDVIYNAQGAVVK